MIAARRSDETGPAAADGILAGVSADDMDAFVGELKRQAPGKYRITPDPAGWPRVVIREGAEDGREYTILARIRRALGPSYLAFSGMVETDRGIKFLGRCTGVQQDLEQAVAAFLRFVEDGTFD